MFLSSSRSPPPPDLFRSTDGLRELISPHNIAGFSGTLDGTPPIPTNDWWGNLLAWDRHSGRDSDPIFSNPYVYHVTQNQHGLSISYLHDYRTDGPINENGAIKYYFYPATVKNLVFSATEWTSGVQLEIESWDDLGCTLQLSGSSQHRPEGTSPAQLLRTYVSMGNAFTTLEYHGNLHPIVKSEHSILTINGAQYHEGGTIETDGSSSLEIVLNNGHKWLLFYYPETASNLPGSSLVSTRVTMQNNSLVTTEPFNGVVQSAYVSSQASRQQDPDGESKVLALYRNVAGVFPTGATLFTEDDGEAFGFDWKLKQANDVMLNSCATDAFLHFAPSHLQVMIDSTFVIRKPELVLWSHTRGPMQAYTLRGADSKWRFVTPKATSDAVNAQATELLPVGTHIPGHFVQKLGLVEIVKQEIASDWNQYLPNEGSYYFKGKALQKFATMVLVAKNLSMTTSPELQPVFEQGLVKLRDILKQFAKNQAAYPLVYDTVYKGIITSEALHKRDYNVDFGNAVYNDHHYHYGYHITAVAMLLHLDGQTTSDNHKPEDYAELRVFVETLIRDVVNTDASDVFFPRFRMFNWFLGHSYSHGVTPMADGKDEESTSEEVNFLYGLALYGHVTEQKSVENLAKLMLKVNALAIETYFLISDDRIGTIHPASFGKNKVTGICFDNKCDYATWFNPARECIHGIQMIPVSPMLVVVRSPSFIREEWEQILSKLDCIKNWESQGSGWTSLLYSNAAVLIPEQACEVLSKCPVDDGLSRAWALFMAASKIHN